MKDNISHNYEVIVIGAGHAGCEAGLVAARMGMKTAMFCTDIESVAMMPCNPSIGGTGKGHLVREIDALGGEMGVNTDKTFIQSKMLNTSKGPAVHSLRAQADKHRYHDEILRTIEGQERLVSGTTSLYRVRQDCHQRALSVIISASWDSRSVDSRQEHLPGC